MRNGKIRRYLQRAAIARHRLIELSQVAQGVAQIDVRLGKIRLELQGPAIARHRGLELSEFLQGIAEVVVRSGFIWQELRRLAQGRQRGLRTFALHAQGRPQNVPGYPRIGMAREQRSRLLFHFAIAPGFEQGDQPVDVV